MNLKELEQHFVTALYSLYGADEAKSLFYIIAEHSDKWSRSYILMHGDREIEAERVKNYQHILEELKTGKPLQYIFSETLFYGLTFRVNPAVLIPRPETEELVDWILDVVQGDHPKHILDIGTGSGCIAISLKNKLRATVVSALDVSKAALAVAAENAALNNLDVHFIAADILNYEGQERYDLIVSNPPYIKEDERAEMHLNVLEHEPHLALFVTNEAPLVFYEAIADFALAHLTTNGRLFFEINEYLGQETAGMLKAKGYHSIALKQDMQGKDRMIYCRL